MTRELEHLSYEKKNSYRVGVAQPGKEKALRRPQCSLQYLNGPTRKLKRDSGGVQGWAE